MAEWALNSSEDGARLEEEMKAVSQKESWPAQPSLAVSQTCPVQESSDRDWRGLAWLDQASRGLALPGQGLSGQGSSVAAGPTPLV